MRCTTGYAPTLRTSTCPQAPAVRKVGGAKFSAILPLPAPSEAQKLEQASETARLEEARRKHTEKVTRDLFGAVRRGDIKAVAPLIAKGADLSARVLEGLTAEEYARKLGRSEIAAILAQANVQPPECEQAAT